MNAQDWAEEVACIVEQLYPTAQKITLIQDDLSVHKKVAVYECFAPERAQAILAKLEFVFTPKHGSWLNIAEIELSILTRQELPTRVASQAELRACVTVWYEQHNAYASTVNWQFTTQDVRIKLKPLYPSFNS